MRVCILCARVHVSLVYVFVFGIFEYLFICLLVCLFVLILIYLHMYILYVLNNPFLNFTVNLCLKITIFNFKKKEKEKKT